MEDAITAHQRPKLERYGDTLFIVLRSANYHDDTEQVDFGELHLFVGPNLVLTVRHGESPDLATVRRRVEDEPDLLRLGPEAVLCAVLDAQLRVGSPSATRRKIRYTFGAMIHGHPTDEPPRTLAEVPSELETDPWGEKRR